MLVDKNGTIKILDMGLARFSDDSQGSLTREYDQKMIGTVDYLAPEQAIDSHSVDARADIYSLGCTLYFLLTGDAPFPQGTIPQRLLQHQSGEPADICLTRPDAPPALVNICRKMMAKKAEDRYQTAEDVAQALADWLAGRAIGTHDSPGAPPDPRSTRTSPWLRSTTSQAAASPAKARSAAPVPASKPPAARARKALHPRFTPVPHRE